MQNNFSSSYNLNGNQGGTSRIKRFPSLTVSGIGLMIFLVLYFVASIVITAIAVVNRGLLNDYGFNMANIIVSQLLCMLPPVLIAMQISKCDFLSSMRLRKGVNFIQVMILLVVAAGAFFFANGINNVIMTLLQQTGYTPMDSGFTVNTVPQLIFSALLYGLLPAFCEEFFFRGMIMRSFERFSPVLAVFMSSILFGLMHGNIEQLFFAIVFGLILSLLVLVTDSIVPSMILHFTNNVAAMLLTYMADKMETGQEVQYTSADMLFSAAIWIVLGAFILLASITGYIFYTRHRNKIKYGSEKPEELISGFARKLRNETCTIDTYGNKRCVNPAGRSPVAAYIMLGAFIAAELVMIVLSMAASYA